MLPLHQTLPETMSIEEAPARTRKGDDMIRKQFTLYLENRPGMLARITRMLAAKQVNIDGISVSASTDIGLVQIVVDNANAARRVLKAAKVPFVVQDVALLPMKNEPGALADLVTKVARRGININYVYATGCDCSKACNCYAIISAPDLKKVEQASRSVW
jgi:hypothetical protein